jgi:hypothetical protein
MLLKSSGMGRPAGQTQIPLWLRWAGIALGILFMVWLPIEDVHVNYVVGLSCGICAWFVVRYFAVRWDDLSRWLMMLWGGAAGLGVPLVAVGLMVFKAGIHAHGFLDFANAQILEVLQSAPWWIVLGIIVSSFASLLSEKK